MKEKNQIKTKIGVGSVVKAKVGETEEKTSEARVRRMNKEVVRYVQDMVRKNKFLVKFIDTLLGLGLGLGLGLEFRYIQRGDVCTHPHYFQATSELQPIKY